LRNECASNEAMSVRRMNRWREYHTVLYATEVTENTKDPGMKDAPCAFRTEESAI
jgi:hypothetical protein